jgi:hypothetical protein
VIKIGHYDTDQWLSAPEHRHLIFERAPVQQSGQVVRRCLELSFGHDSEQTKPGARQFRNRFQILDGLVWQHGMLGSSHVNDANGSAHDRHRHARCRKRTLWTVSEFRTGVELVTV